MWMPHVLIMLYVYLYVYVFWPYFIWWIVEKLLSFENYVMYNMTNNKRKNGFETQVG